jgi:hypothetical protein
MAIFSGLAAIGTAIGGVVSAFMGSTIGALVLKAAVGLGINLLAQSLAGKPKEPLFSINGTLQGGGDLPRTFILGRTATAGSLVWANTWGRDGETPNAYLTQVIALSDLPTQSLDELWVNGERKDVDWANPHPQYGAPVAGYPDALWVKFYDGTQTAADPFLVTAASNAQRTYDASRVGWGVSYAVVTAKVTKNLFSGIPNFKFVVTGCRLYDISKDSTAGGVGPHRWDNPATWGGDGDHLPAVQAYNLLRGLTYNGKWIYGLQGLAAARLPAANWIAQVNKCRAPILGHDGYEPTYRCAGEIPVEAPLATALESILTSCIGRISEVGGVYSIHVGAPDLPTVSFTDGDILSTEEQSFTPFFGLADTINGISATYPSPADAWSTKAAPPLYRADLEAQHGNRRLMADVPLDMVPYAEQVQRLMRSALEEGQRARRHTLVLPPEFWPYAVPGEILSWTSARNGYITKLFRIDGAADRANLDVMVDVTEVDPSDYDWNSDADFKPPVDGAVGPIRPQPQPIIDWNAEPAYVPDNTGKPRRPAILLSWDNAEGRLVDVIGIEFEVRLATTLATVYGGRTDQPEVGSLLISQGLLPLTAYGVRGRYIAGSDRPTLWSNWLSVITPDVRFSSDDIFDIDLNALAEDVKRLTKWIGDDTRILRDKIEALATNASDQDLRNYDDKASLRREVVVVANKITAGYTEAINVAVGPGSAIANQIETLTVEIAGKASVEALNAVTVRVDTIDGELSIQGAAIQHLEAEIEGKASAVAFDALYVQVNGSGGIAERLSGVEFAMDGTTASSRFRMSAGYTPGPGWSARIGMEARVNSGSTYRAAGMYLDVTATSARVVFDVSQFIITDGSSTAAPFVFSGGVAYMENARIGTVYFNQLMSTNGKLIIKGYGNEASIEIWS